MWHKIGRKRVTQELRQQIVCCFGAYKYLCVCVCLCESCSLGLHTQLRWMARTPTHISAFSASLSEPGGWSQMAWERNVDGGGRRRINIASICRRSLLSLRADFYMICAHLLLKCWKYRNISNNGAERKTGRARPEVSLLFMEREELLSGSLQGEKDWSPHFFFFKRSPRALPKNSLSFSKLLQISPHPSKKK